MAELADLLEQWDWAENPPAQDDQVQVPAPAPQWVEEPVPLDVFISDAKYLKNPPLSEVQFGAVQVAERIYFESTYSELALSSERSVREYWAHPVPMVNFVTMQWGKGGGKDHTCRLMSMRVAYLLLCLPSPQEYFRFAPQDEIHLLNVAASSHQANRAFFGPMRSAVMRKGCWLEPYADPLQGSIRYAHGIEAISGHSDAETQEGLNLLLAVADEVDAFKREEELEAHRPGQGRESTKSAEAILKMMRTSMMTRFPQTGKNVVISYPRYKGSMIQTLTAAAVKDNEKRGERSRYWVSGPLPTWVANPLRKRSDFEQEYEDDEILAKARYECDPAAAIHPYFSNEIAMELCCVDEPAERVTVRYEPARRAVRHPDGEMETVTSWDARYDFSAALLPRTGAIYSMHADLALRSDRAGVAMAHVKQWDEVHVVGTGPEGEDVPRLERRPVVAVDFVIGFEAELGAKPPREIQIRWVIDLFTELRRRGFNVRWFSFDQFQSAALGQDLERNGIETKRISTDLTTEPYRGLRDLFNEGRIQLPVSRREDGREPRVLHELYALSRLANGKLDHPVGGSKDEADALACAVQGAVQMGGHEDGGVAFPGTHQFSGVIEEDTIPVGFVPPGVVGGFEYGMPLQHHHVDLDAWEDSVYGDGLGESGMPLRSPD